MPDARTNEPGPAWPRLLGGVHLAGIRFDADVVPAGVGERGGEVAGATADVDEGPPGRGAGVGGCHRSVTMSAVSAASAP